MCESPLRKDVRREAGAAGRTGMWRRPQNAPRAKVRLDRSLRSLVVIPTGRPSPVPFLPRHRLPALVLAVLGTAAAPSAGAQTYTLGTLANRAEELPMVGELAAQSSALGAQQRRYATDYGLHLDYNAAVYPGYVTNDQASARATAWAASVDLVWELLDGGLAEALTERRRLESMQTQTSSSLRNAREDARTAVRILALSMLQAEQRAEGAREAAAFADTVETRYDALYETRDVLRSTLLDARLRQRRYAEEARRYDELALRIRDELARQLRIDPGFRLEVPEGLPQFDPADLDYAARAAARRNTATFTAPAPAFDELRLALFAGIALSLIHI